jgi:hypothetical protein
MCFTGRCSHPGLVHDLLDANEWTWVFVAVGRAGRVKNQQVKRLATLASGVGCRCYCGRIADARRFTRLRLLTAEGPDSSRALLSREIAQLAS